MHAMNPPQQIPGYYYGTLGLLLPEFESLN